MATATAAHAHSSPTAARVSGYTHNVPPPPNPPPLSSHPSGFAATVGPDEAWVRQLQEEQQERFAEQAMVMHRELLTELESAGPFASHQTREALQARYDERLEQMRTMQQEELDQHVEMERQERLWSLGLQDGTWEGWNRVIQDQAAILANIQRTATMDTDAGVQERIRENAREAEDVGRRSEEWQRTEHQRVLDRVRWAEQQRLTSAHVDERRQRDRVEAENQAAQARTREANLRETLASQSQSAPSSRPDSLFSAAPSSTDTPASSAYSWRPSPITIPTKTDETHRDRLSPGDDLRRASPARPSPLSGTPTSHTMMYAKGEEPARPTVWIPPEGTREPTRKGSMSFDAREPTRKSSGRFDASGPARKSSVQFGSGAQEDPPASRTSPSPHPQSQPQAPPNAPSLRTAPLPTPQQTYASQNAQSPQPQSPLRPTTQARPAAPPPATNVFPQPRKQETNIPSKTAPTTNLRPAPSPATARPAQTVPQTARPAPPMSSARPAAAPPPHDPAEDRRKHLRDEYRATEAKRVEEERRRRDEEANEKRAEEARRRGAEKRRAEEEAREAERKEAERRARAAGIKTGPTRQVDMAEAWAAYENQWAAMASATRLRFRSIPWPVSVQVLEPSGLIPIQIAAFVLSPTHSQGKARKDRLKEALLRWHPDRFETKWLQKVVEEEREMVKEGVGNVIRALNELFSAEGTFAA